MGNPAMVRRKKSEKRRKKFEARLGPGAYLPKEDREQLNAEIATAEAEAKAAKEKATAARKAKAAEKAAAKKK
ncbi:MAG: hypothetical protein K2P78_13340 [Gemmataceae bacterium]|nr:hypothetical protein [Gemmataceae bacterium]